MPSPGSPCRGQGGGGRGEAGARGLGGSRGTALVGKPRKPNRTTTARETAAPRCRAIGRPDDEACLHRVSRRLPGDRFEACEVRGFERLPCLLFPVDWDPGGRGGPKRQGGRVARGRGWRYRGQARGQGALSRWSVTCMSPSQRGSRGSRGSVGVQGAPWCGSVGVWVPFESLDLMGCAACRGRSGSKGSSDAGRSSPMCRSAPERLIRRFQVPRNLGSTVAPAAQRIHQSEDRRAPAHTRPHTRPHPPGSLHLWQSAAESRPYRAFLGGSCPSLPARITPGTRAIHLRETGRIRRSRPMRGDLPTSNPPSCTRREWQRPLAPRETPPAAFQPRLSVVGSRQRPCKSWEEQVYRRPYGSA